MIINFKIFMKTLTERQTQIKEKFRKELKFSVPKESEDRRRLLIDLENQVGVILRESDGFFIVMPYENKFIDSILISQHDEFVKELEEIRNLIQRDCLAPAFDDLDSLITSLKK